MNLLENQSSDPRKIELQLKGKLKLLILGFLSESTEKFMKELWGLLIQAQNSENGIPEVLLKEKEEELKLKSEKNLEKVKFLEKMLGEKVSIKKDEDIPQPDKKEEEDENKETKSANPKIEVKYARYVPKDRRHSRDEKRTDNKRSHYHESSRKRSYSRSRSRSRSRNNDKKRRDKYKEDSHRNSFSDERQKNRDRNSKR